MTTRTITRLSLFTVCAATAASGAQQPPAVRPLGPIVRVTTEPLASVAGVRRLPDGRVFVNDITAHRLLLLDSTFATALVVVDSTSATAKAYGARPGTLIAYDGDSTLFVDPASLSMLVLDAAGKIRHVVAVPRASDVNYLIGSIYGTPGFDAQGRLVYRGTAAPGPPVPIVDGQVPRREAPDSAPIVRMDLASRKLDTAGQYRIPKLNTMVSQMENGLISVSPVINPLPLTDDWAVLPDGSIAIVRGRDFHVDWVGTNGDRTSTPKIPFDWHHLSDDDKVAVIDSARRATEARDDSTRAARESLRVARGRGAAARPSAAQTVAIPLRFVEPNALPDYAPAFTQGATRADAEGNLWIRTTENVNGQPVYDVVNRRGELTDRVQLPPFRTIAGFGRGLVYTAVRDSAGVVHLECARVR